MRLITMLGLVLVASVAALALVGVSSAAAAELCKAAEAECSEANVDKEGTEFTASSSKALLETNLATITCKKSTVKGETAAEAGRPLPAYITAMSFSECTLGEAKCTVTSLHLPYYDQLERTGEDTGTMAVSDGGEGKVATKIECSGSISCTVGATEVVLDDKGGSPATIEASKEPFTKESGFLCPTTASFTATYSVETPTEVHIEQVPTKLCKVAPNGAGQCPAGEGFAGAVKTELLSATAVFKATAGTISCEETALTGQNFVEAGTGSINAMKFESAGVCSSTLPSSPGVAVTVENLPFSRSSFIYRSATRAILAASGPVTPAAPILKLKIELPTVNTCRYRDSRASWIITAYNPMKMKSAWLAVLMGAGNGTACPPTLTLEAELNVKRSADNGNLWVTK